MSDYQSRRLAVIVLIMAGLASCDRQSSPAGAIDHKSDREPSPRTVIERLISLRDRAAYQELDELIVPERGRQVAALLMAVDDFLHANDALCKYVRREFAVGLSQAIDQSHWSNNLGVFSAHVELLDEQIDGDQATVAFMVDGRLPVRRAELSLIDGHWRYEPGPGYDRRLVEAFNEMAHGLRQALSGLKAGRPAAADINSDPELLLEEIRLRLSKGAGLLPSPPTTQPSGDSASSRPAEQP
jgi:hypothetical protein